MQQLIQQVAQRTGVSEDKAQAAVDTVVGYLKDHLPGPVASQLDNAMSGESGEQGGGLMGKAKGMFGGNKQSG
jgi:uncharacterized protein (DUF2267 family)